ncbi:hypothetical protein [Cohnella boryungensis]|uniref:Uncharacterized protein n=1 Tax=Cohnella boryungensis TaxID=768479 RepID=A0ABV8SGG6_9BACL
MRPLHESINPTELKDIRACDTVVFRLVNDHHFSGTSETVSAEHDEFTFVGRGAHLHATEIYRIEKHVPAVPS